LVTVILKETTMKMWKIFRGHSVIALGLLVAVFIFASFANATVLTPGGGPVASSAITVGAPGTTVTSFLNEAFSTATISGTLSEWVVKDGTGLDFIYQVTDTTGFIEQLAVNDFAPVGAVNVGTTTGYGAAPTGGSTTPSAINENLGGTINFTIGTAGMVPGQVSVDYIVQTTATSYVSTTESVIDSSTANPAGIGPAPEPGSVGLLLGGLFGLGLFVTRRFRVQQS
jgi:hypothetical protein